MNRLPSRILPSPGSERSALALRPKLGDNGPGSPIVADADGTLHLRGPAGAVFTFGQLLEDAGYPEDVGGAFGPIGGMYISFALTANGVVVADAIHYRIQAGDQLVLSISGFPST
jgi:hypothetical protein